jgi:hypothetical protein
MNLGERMGMLFEVQGESLTIAGATLTGLCEIPPTGAGPWADEPAEAPSVTLLYDDLETAGLWPLDDPEVVIDGTNYRVIASERRDGLVELWLQEKD